MILKNKNAVIYGAAGAIGSTVARAFAREGARVFLTGRSLAKLEAIAGDIRSEGGEAHLSLVDALHEKAVRHHLHDVVQKFGTIDISFNAIGIPQAGIQGIPLAELSAENFVLPVSTYTQSNFLTAQAAARYMTAQQSGVIITLTATPSQFAAPLVGGMAPAWAAIESLTRTFAGELGPSGVRVVCLRADGMPETDTITEVFGLHAKGAGMPSHKEFQTLMEGMTLLKRLPKLSEVANVAVFVASDYATAMTGTVVNVSCGSVVD